MSLDLLGEGFDLHLGGLDLTFPHHENERAQAVAAGKHFARRWAHNGMVVDESGEKMSKSVGNITSLPQLLERYDARVLRTLVVQSHYRSPVVVTRDALGSAQGALDRLDNFARETRALGPASPDPATLERFKWRMDDDLDTSGALAVIFGAVRDARADPGRAPALAAAVQECCAQGLGLALAGADEELDGDVAALVVDRDEARRQKDWAAADAIRSRLEAMGYMVEDSPAGTVVRRER
jgi:cysteinyl-tRNA synthetase